MFHETKKKASLTKKKLLEKLAFFQQVCGDNPFNVKK